MIFFWIYFLQAFTEMQVNKIETSKKLKMIELQGEMLKTSKKKYDITDKEVTNMAPDTRYVVGLTIFMALYDPQFYSIISWRKINLWIPICLFCRVYSSVGRMFVLSTLPQVHDELVNKQSKCDEMSKQLEEKKEFLLKCSKEQEDNLRELVQQRKEAGSN